MLSLASTEDSSKTLAALILPALESGQSVQLEQSDSLHKVIAFCRAHGESTDNIATKLGVSKDAVDRLCRKEHFVSLVLEMQTALEMTPKEKLKAAAGIALDERIKLMGSSDVKVRDSVTRDFLDRELGKPTQRVENLNMTFNANADMLTIRKDINQSRSRLQDMQEQRIKLLSSRDDINS